MKGEEGEGTKKVSSQGGMYRLAARKKKKGPVKILSTERKKGGVATPPRVERGGGGEGRVEQGK